jgi:predicted  nucleic acid-binding Zn-ribbon protein
MKELERLIATEQKAADQLESSITKIYADFSNGKITKEVFQQKKSTINETVARKRTQIEKWANQIASFEQEKNAAESAIDEVKLLYGVETLNREVVDLLIEKILVHGEKDIEIVWNGRFADA